MRIEVSRFIFVSFSFGLSWFYYMVNIGVDIFCLLLKKVIHSTQLALWYFLRLWFGRFSLKEAVLSLLRDILRPLHRLAKHFCLDWLRSLKFAAILPDFISTILAVLWWIILRVCFATRDINWFSRVRLILLKLKLASLFIWDCLVLIRECIVWLSVSGRGWLLFLALHR